MSDSQQPPLAFNSLPFEQAYRLDRDWFGAQPSQEIHVLFAVDAGRLWFAGMGSGSFHYDETHEKGSFVEGLWEQDLVELYLFNKDNGRYVEINLSPTGAWWSAVFSAPRDRINTWNAKSAEAFSWRSDDGWKAALSIQLDELTKPLEGMATHANMTAIVNTPEHQFLTLNQLPGSKPNFHQPLNFQAINFS